MKGLVIRSPWIDLILAGSKTWEMRTKATSIRGRIALIKAGSGSIYGTAELAECLPARTPEQMQQTQNFHAIPDEQIASAIENRWTTPWVLRDIVRFPKPKPYSHPSGAVTWVTLPDDGSDNAPQKSATTIRKAVSNSKTIRPRQSVVRTLVPVGSVSEWVDIQLTDGNLRNGHFYLRSAERLLPADCIGGPNKSQPAANIRVRFDPGMLAETDVAGDKMILRARASVRDFFDRSGAKAGDCLRFSRTGKHEFVVTLRRANPA